MAIGLRENKSVEQEATARGGPPVCFVDPLCLCSRDEREGQGETQEADSSRERAKFWKYWATRWGRRVSQYFFNLHARTFRVFVTVRGGFMHGGEHRAARIPLYFSIYRSHRRFYLGALLSKCIGAFFATSLLRYFGMANGVETPCSRANCRAWRIDGWRLNYPGRSHRESRKGRLVCRKNILRPFAFARPRSFLFKVAGREKMPFHRFCLILQTLRREKE